MIFFILTEFVFLYLLSRAVIQSIYRLAYLTTMNKNIAITFISILFFPGTVIHELSHWLVAELLRVPTGEITLHPIVEKEGRVRIGSVAIARTDPVRRLLIGLAPILAGLTLILAVTYLYRLTMLPFPQNTSLFLYLLLTVGNTMFSSRRDVEGFVIITIVVSLISFSLYRVGLWPNLSVFQTLTTQLATLLTPTLALLISIDLVVLVPSYGIIWGMQKTLKRKIVANPND